MPYIPSKRGRGRPRKYVFKKRRFPYYSKAMSRMGMTFTRWSAKDTTNNCHEVISGNASGTDIPANTVFRLSDTSGFGELKNLFDNYCIRKVLYRFVLWKDPNSATIPNGNALYPRLSWVHDFNDSVPISRLQMMQHPKLREFWFGDNKQHTRWYSLKPASLTQLFEGTLATASKPAWNQFVDTVDQDMPHYGLKYVTSNLFTGNFILLEAKVIISCKGIS